MWRDMRPATSAMSVHGRLVHTPRLTARVIDPFSLANLNDKDIEVDVVDFGSCAQLGWFVGPNGCTKAYNMWWESNTKTIPLLCEIKNAIRIVKGRRLGNWKAQATRTFVFVKVRGVSILVGNTVRGVTLALRNAEIDTELFEDKANILGWFLTELTKDINTIQDTRRDYLTVRVKKRKAQNAAIDNAGRTR